MRPRISIVVPIFNMERYLGRCLHSLLGQTMRDIEVIAVNDGSTDGSLAIAREYAAADSRLIVIDSANGGVAAARNRGLAHCRGEYIGFADPDDWADADMYESMYGAAVREGADIAMCAYVREFGTHAKIKPFPFPDGLCLRGEAVQLEMTRRLIGPIGEELGSPEHLDAWGTVWSKLYSAALIRDNGLVFTDLERIGSCEDTLFNVAAFGKAQSFVFLNRPYYHYWKVNDASITTVHKPRLQEQFRTLYGLLQPLADAAPSPALTELYGAALRNRIAMNVLGLGLNIASGRHKASLWSKRRELKRLLAAEPFRSALAALETRHCPPVWQVFFAAAKQRLALSLLLLLLCIEYMRTRSASGRKRNEVDSYSSSRHRHEPGRTGDDADELLPEALRKRHTV